MPIYLGIIRLLGTLREVIPGEHRAHYDQQDYDDSALFTRGFGAVPSGFVDSFASVTLETSVSVLISRSLQIGRASPFLLHPSQGEGDPRHALREQSC